MPVMDVQRNAQGGNLPPTDTTNAASVGVSSASNLPEFNTLVGTVSTKLVGNATLNSQFSIAGVGNAADATDDTLFTYTLPAAFLGVNAEGIKVTASGSFGATANNKTVKIFFGATAVATTGVVTNNATSWHAEAHIYRTAAATQLGDGLICTALLPFPTKTAPGETLANALVVKVTGASPTSSAASDVVGFTFKVEAFGI